MAPDPGVVRRRLRACAGVGTPGALAHLITSLNKRRGLKMTVVLSIMAILISVASFVFSIISYRRSLRIKKIETFLEFGTPEEIDKRIEYLREDERITREEIERTYAERKRGKAAELSAQGLGQSGIKEKALSDLEEEKKREIQSLERHTQREIERLELKKSQIKNL